MVITKEILDELTVKAKYGTEGRVPVWRIIGVSNS